MSKTDVTIEAAPNAAPDRKGWTIFDHLNLVERMMISKLSDRGLEAPFLDRGTFEVCRLSEPNRKGVAGYSCTVRAAVGLGVMQPLSAHVTIGGGRLDIVAEELAEAIVEEVLHLHGRRQSHAAARAAVKDGAARAIAIAAREGFELELLSVQATAYDPRFPRHDGEIFDVEIMMLGDDNGTIEMDRYVMDAEDGEEFARYLGGTILREQREFARLWTGQDL